MSETQDMKARLRDQLGFLKRSAEAFDAGSKEEALRIATTLRVIFHNTRNSTSLLMHLQSTNVTIRSMAPDRSRATAQLGGRAIVSEFSWSLMELSPTPGGLVAGPITAPRGADRMIEAPQWWDEKIAHLNGVDYTRCAIVLWAANKDGGAHVDSQIPPNYSQLKADGAFGSTEDSISGVNEIEDAHFVVLRTMAFEVLNSPNLMALQN